MGELIALAVFMVAGFVAAYCVFVYLDGED
jgi:hypothetical protein